MYKAVTDMDTAKELNVVCAFRIAGICRSRTNHLSYYVGVQQDDRLDNSFYDISNNLCIHAAESHSYK